MYPTSIERGQIYYADLDPSLGSEQGGVRPVLVIQNDVGNRHSPTIIVAALTGKIYAKHNLPTHLLIPFSVGLKWNAFDFKKKVFKIGHTVTQFTLDDKVIVVEKDRGKTEDSVRSLPLIQPVEDMLLRMKKEQEKYRYLCGDFYNQDFLDYVYVNKIGERVQPAHITDHFKTSVIRKNKLEDICFHGLRHSCASLLFQCGIPLKEIQECLGILI